MATKAGCESVGDIVEHTFPEPNLKASHKRIRYVVMENGCWECTSHRKRAGYPLVKRGGSEISMNRYVCQLKTGRKIPHTLVVMHLCDNPGCINPDHLEPGTQKQNMRDKMDKGRGYIPWVKGKE